MSAVAGAARPRTRSPLPRQLSRPSELSAKRNAYPVDTSAALSNLLRSSNRETIQVSFRGLVPWIRVGERGTHYLHSYPAKLLPQIAHFFLAATILGGRDAVVLDPFGGTGTVALEALLSGRQAYFADANPLARIIASVKTRLLPVHELQAAFERVKARYKRLRARGLPDVVNLHYWYESTAIRALCRVKLAIDAEEHEHIKDLLLVTFSSVARRASRADPRLAVPLRRKLAGVEVGDVQGGTGVWRLFEQQFSANLSRQVALREFGDILPAAECVGHDARNLRGPADWREQSHEQLRDASVDLVITSPPYTSAQKYIRASSLSLGWLGLAAESDLRSLERLNIGREHLSRAEVDARPVIDLPVADTFIQATADRDSQRAAILATYLVEMRQALGEVVRVLKPGGHLVLVIGDNQVCGKLFASSAFLAEILERSGMKLRLKLVDEIRSRGLITKRHETSGVITKEWILLFQKLEMVR